MVHSSPRPSCRKSSRDTGIEAAIPECSLTEKSGNGAGSATIANSVDKNPVHAIFRIEGRQEAVWHHSRHVKSNWLRELLHVAPGLMSLQQHDDVQCFTPWSWGMTGDLSRRADLQQFDRFQHCTPRQRVEVKSDCVGMIQVRCRSVPAAQSGTSHLGETDRTVRIAWRKSIPGRSAQKAKGLSRPRS